MPKERLSASVDTELLAAGRATVAAGRAENLSAWVNAALQRQVEHDEWLRAMDEYLAAYEAEHGEITEAEMEAAYEADQKRAVVVNPSRPSTPARRAQAS